MNMMERWEPAFPLSLVERKVVDREVKMHLHSVRYDVFERCIKRYGYTGRITDRVFDEVADEVKIHNEELKDRNNVIHYYFQNDVVFDHGNYDT